MFTSSPTSLANTWRGRGLQCGWERGPGLFGGGAGARGSQKARPLSAQPSSPPEASGPPPKSSSPREGGRPRVPSISWRWVLRADRELLTTPRWGPRALDMFWDE